MTSKFYITEITDNNLKSKYTKEILELLPEWFGNKQALHDYIEAVKLYPFWTAFSETDQCLGFFSVKIHYQSTGDIFVCGVHPAYHHMGIGKSLYKTAEKYFIQHNCKYVIVKTLSDSVHFEPYAKTRKFYKSVGFESLITLTEMWDEYNPCLIMIKSLANRCNKKSPT